MNWALARQRGWKMLLRIDDLEGPRIKPSADLQALEDLAWLGLDWVNPPLWQSHRKDLYQRALNQLSAAGYIYPCTCTRSEIESAAAGRTEPDQAVFYPGTCRGRYESAEQALRATGRAPALRFMVPSRDVSFVDELLGPRTFRGQRDFGDFVIRKADGEWGYHLANVVDDIDLGVTHIVRGEDLLASAPRQILIYEAMGLESGVPAYLHLPLVVGPDGRKLAKRHGDTRLCQLRDEGVTPGQVRAMLARWSGIEITCDEISIDEWVAKFDLARVPRTAVVYDDTHQRPRAVRGGS